MSLWYDIKHKNYATDHRGSWIRSYAERLVAALRNDTDAKFNSHFGGSLGRHTAADIDCTDGTTVQAALDREASDRISFSNELRNDMNAADSAIRSDMNAADAAIRSDMDTADAELRSAVEAEAETRSNADAGLQENINAEAAARAAVLALKVDKESGKVLSSNDYTDAEKSKLSGIQTGAQVNTVTSVAGRTGAVTLTKSDVGLGNIDNTSDKNKPISDATQTALNSKADASALSQKADISEVLTKTNTTSYTPSASYHPATKKYVDDLVSDSGGGDMLRSVYDTDGDGIVDNAEKLAGNPASYYAMASTVNGKAPKDHASGSNTYGIGTDTKYGHLKVVDNLTTTASTTGTALSANQGRVLNEKISALQTPPSLTSVTTDGIEIGASGWTGTGYFCTAANTKYTVTFQPYVDGNVTDSSIHGFTRFCLKPAEKTRAWQNWTPFFTYNGKSYEFFYSPSRGLYEALIPNAGLAPAEVLTYIEWKNYAPTILNYGKMRALGFFEAKDTSGNTTALNTWIQPETILRDTSGAIDDTDWQKMMQQTTQNYWDADLYALDTASLSLIFLLYDLNADGKWLSTDWMTCQTVYQGSAPLPLNSIDNFA